MRSFDVIIIGGGHNGLVAGAVLAKAGRRVVILEAADTVGGAARTVEFAPGFSVSHVAHIVNMLHEDVIRELDLRAHGLAFPGATLSTTTLDSGGRHLTIRGGELSGDISSAERVAWSELWARLVRFARVLKPALTQKPPRLAGGGMSESLTLGKLGLGIRRLGRDDMREFLRMMLMPVADVLEDELTDQRLIGAVAFDAVLGTHMGPRSPNSLMTLYYRLAGEIDGVAGALALPNGGMGRVSAAMAGAARALGCEIRTGARVANIRLREGRADGVTLADGDEIKAPVVLSTADPRATLHGLLGPRQLETEVNRQVVNYRARGNAAKLHLALSGRPDIPQLEGERLGDRLLIAPELMAVENAFNPAKYGEYSSEPVMEIVLPTLADPTLAPPGKHVLSAIVQFAPYQLRQGWEAGRKPFLELCLRRLEAYSPGLTGLVEHAELLTPRDLEASYGLPGGHWHHGELTIDQMFMLRPFAGSAQYALPVGGLYLGGAGAHPGGGVSGVPGLNAARCILASEVGK